MIWLSWKLDLCHTADGSQQCVNMTTEAATHVYSKCVQPESRFHT